MTTSGLNTILTKPPGLLTEADVVMIATSGLPEDSVTEFKETVPGGAWDANQDFNKEGKAGLLKEIIAFANAFGGSLYVGIEESSDDPKRAIAIKPVAQVGALASRLENVLRDTVEPRLLSPEIVPVVTNPATGEGVLVVRVSRSPLAPHWSRTERRCYRRIGTSSQEIGMLDIQSITLDRARTGADIERLFNDRQDAFTETWNAYSSERANRLNIVNFSPNNPSIPTGFGLRCSAVPTVPVTVADVTARDELKLGIGPVICSSGPASQSLSFPALTENGYFRPGLRSWRYERRGNDPEDFLQQQLVRGDGILETTFIRIPSVTDTAILPIEHVVALFSGLLIALEMFRVRADLTNVAYEIEFEVITRGLIDIYYFHGHQQPGLLRFQQSHTRFPRYLYEGRPHAATLIEAFQTDLWNSIGRRVGGPIGLVEVDLPLMWQVVDHPFS